MNTSQAATSLSKINAQSATLEASSLVSFYEIDVTEIASTEALIKAFRSINFNYNGDVDGSKIFRFHNNLKLINKNLKFNAKTYVALPINISGFEITSNGSLPAPKLSMAASVEGDINFSNFKMFLRHLNGLSGAKVTRIRTFLKYIDGINFYSGWGASTNCLTHTLTPDDPIYAPPTDFCPDPFATFPKDVFYVDRKSLESKNFIELELASLIDVQGVLLPARMVMEKKCPWQYRGEGCCYEYSANGSAITHGSSTLPTLAHPVANEKDEKILDIITSYNPTNSVPASWTDTSGYTVGQIVKIKIDELNYYFVSKGATPAGAPPPNEKYWTADQCSKSLKGCKLRWKNNTIFNGFLPFGGFPGIQSRG